MKLNQDNRNKIEKQGFVYILTNKIHSVLYVGSAENVMIRYKNHKNKKDPNSFTARYNVNKLVYFKRFELLKDARLEEKRLKAGNRARKMKLINEMNPEWKDLYCEL